MRFDFIIAGLALFSAQVAFAADAPRADRLVTLPAPSGAEQEYACTKDRVWCLRRPLGEDENVGPLSVLHMENGDLRFIGVLPLHAEIPNEDDSQQTLRVGFWPEIVRLGDDGLLLGFTKTHDVGYSGGGASVTYAHVFEAKGGDSMFVRPAFAAPVESSISIRACFGEDDVKDRRGACSDDYDFRATIKPASGAGVLRLIYKSNATTYPAGISRDADSSAAPPLKAGDLRKAINAACSVTRVISRDANGAFVWDKPLPTCSDFLEP